MRTKFLIFSTCFISSALLILFIINIKKGQKPIFETKNINKELKTLNRFTNFFIENKGQLSDTICYYAKIKGGKVYITNSGKIFYSLISKKDTAYNIISFAENFGKEIKGKIIGKNKLKTKVNYFKGNNSEKWRKNIDCYKEICFGEIYHGINLSLKATNNNVEKIFTVMPGANPDNIKILLGNTSNIRINNKGELKIKTIQGEILFTKPIAYQKIRGKKQFVDITYTIDSSNYGFKIGEYNNDYPLIIDPLINSTYIGGSGMEQIKDAIQDKDGN
ncbi:MAG: hypothetical protein KAG95_04370, partial [Bacteroidales bacterium]|nr:hypothetical protein [Bacteroidales bacterium]